MTPSKTKFYMTSVYIVTVLSGCAKGSLDNDKTAIWGQVAIATTSGAVTSTVSDSVAQMISPQKRSFFAELKNQLNFLPEVFAYPGCPSSSTRGDGCSVDGQSMSLKFSKGRCAYRSQGGGTWVGGTTLSTGSGDGAPDCGDFPVMDGVTISKVTRMYQGSLFSPTYRTTSAGDTSVVLDTSAPSSPTFGHANSKSPTSGTGGWSYNVGAGGGYTRSWVDAKDHDVSFSMRAVGYPGAAPSEGNATFDHTLTSYSNQGMATTGLSVAVSGTTGQLTQVVNGTVYLQDNMGKFTASSTFKDVVFQSGCCFPVSGSTQTSYQGGPLDKLSDTFTFSADTCKSATLGQVDFKNTSGKLVAMTLTHCF